MTHTHEIHRFFKKAPQELISKVQERFCRSSSKIILFFDNWSDQGSYRKTVDSSPVSRRHFSVSTSSVAFYIPARYRATLATWIMPPQRAIRGRLTRRNSNHQGQEDLNALKVQPPQGGVTNVEFRNAIQMLTQVVMSRLEPTPWTWPALENHCWSQENPHLS
uniref:Uncharacterized protein n=1 Tax=Solanum tuberosum TaxID=4113 RepID=M1DQR8_SOLTU